MMRMCWAVQLGRFGATQLWLDASWVPVLPFATWSLAVVYFPQNYPVFAPLLDLALGVAGAAGLLASLLLHDTAHLLLARYFGLLPRTIMLNVPGSVAYPVGEDCLRHRATVAIAAAGPLASILLASATFWGALNAGPLNRPLEALLGYLAVVNALLALLHLIPAWPFDAGWLLGWLLLRLGVKRSVAQRVLVALGLTVGSGWIVVGAWQFVSAPGGLLGPWVALGGALVIWALPTPASVR
jgi:Zn-dependent protease